MKLWAALLAIAALHVSDAPGRSKAAELLSQYRGATVHRLELDNETTPPPLPPEKYQADGPPLAAVAFLSALDVHVVCAATSEPLPKLAVIRGCVLTKRGEPPLLVLRNPCRYVGAAPAPANFFPRNVCHELGHLNGWPADHPQ